MQRPSGAGPLRNLHIHFVSSCLTVEPQPAVSATQVCSLWHGDIILMADGSPLPDVPQTTRLSRGMCAYCSPKKRMPKRQCNLLEDHASKLLHDFISTVQDSQERSEEGQCTEARVKGTVL